MKQHWNWNIVDENIEIVWNETILKQKTLENIETKHSNFYSIYTIFRLFSMFSER